MKTYENFIKPKNIHEEYVISKGNWLIAKLINGLNYSVAFSRRITFHVVFQLIYFYERICLIYHFLLK